jgi:hypothetical protein
MVGDQFLRKAGLGIRWLKTVGFSSSAHRAGRHLEVLALGLPPGQPAVGFYFAIGRVIAQART